MFLLPFVTRRSVGTVTIGVYLTPIHVLILLLDSNMLFVVVVVCLSVYKHAKTTFRVVLLLPDNLSCVVVCN